MRNLGVWNFLFLALLSSSFAEDIPKYFKVGGQLELDPESKDPITNIVWFHQGNLVAEWIQSLDVLEYYGSFEGRTTLDTKTGRLTINNLTDADQGTFSVELNHKGQPQRYIAKAILEVPEPDVWVQPLACHIDSHTECTLRCDGDTTGAEPVTYSWREGDGEWQTGDQEKNITKAGTEHIEEYSCQISNPVSEKPCKPISNPFFVEKISPDPGSSNVAVAVGVTVGVVILAVTGLGVWAWKSTEKVKPYRSSYRSGDITVRGHKRSSGRQPEAAPLIEP